VIGGSPLLPTCEVISGTPGVSHPRASAFTDCSLGQSEPAPLLGSLLLPERLRTTDFSSPASAAKTCPSGLWQLAREKSLAARRSGMKGNLWEVSKGDFSK
jgi:hypothetical protein